MKSILKAILLLGVVAGLAVASIGTALADAPTPNPTIPATGAQVAVHHGFQGTIKSLASTSFILITKKHGEMTINVSQETKYKVPSVKDATLANFKAGDKVAVLVNLFNSGNVALHVKLIPAKPAHMHRVGTIEGYEAGKSITLKSKHGGTSTFVITKDTEIKFRKGATEVKVGERAKVVAKRDPASDQLTAGKILVFGEKHSHGKGSGKTHKRP